MILPLPDRACWTATDARSVLRTEALSNAGEVFLATHTPVESLDVEGSEAATVLQQTEQGLLNSLADPTRTHAFAVVQGEPGSGKSHLIRWLSARWPEGRDVPVLLARADASLEGSLRGLRDAIPPEYRDVIGNIDVRQQATLNGRIADFMSGLTNALAPDYFDQPPKDHAFCLSFDPGDILRVPEVRNSWKAPARIVGLLAGAGGTRNSESASFTVYEVVDLVSHLHAVAAVSSKAGRLLRRIQQELNVIEESERAGLSSERLLASRRTDIPHSAALTEALNARRNHAIQNSLGVSADKLKETFLDLRRALKRDGRRLIILLEDITAWEGIDDSLIDVLIVDASIKPDLCPQIAVVGVTPYYHAQLAGNYRQRITHDVSLGREDGRLQDVANLRDATTRSRFVVRYLAAARVGASALTPWRQGLASNPNEPVPNACDACPMDVRPGCHAAFGEIDGYGLYPFSDHAVNGFFSALKQQDGAMTWRTPRGIIQGVLVPTLTRPEALANRTYPMAEVEAHTGIDRDRTFVTGNAKRLLDARIADPDTRERARRLLAFWGDRQSIETTLLPDGQPAYADVPKAIFDSFELPWIGDEEPQTESNTGTIDESPQTEVKVQPSGLPEVFPPPSEPQAEAPVRDQRPLQRSPQPEPASKTAPKPKTTRPLRTQDVDNFLDEVEIYRRDGTTRTPNFWNRLAFEMVGMLDPAKLDIDPAVFGNLFKEDLVKIEGTTAATRSQYFQLPGEGWMLNGLIAQAEIRSSEHFNGKSAIEQDSTRRALAQCLRRIEKPARKHIAKFVPNLPGGDRWDHVGMLAQVLAVRAWLRGDVSPDAPVERQWWAVIGDEGASRTDPRSRVDSWNEILQGTDKSHVEMRNTLRRAVSLPQGTSSSFGLAAAAPAVAAIGSLIRLFRITERPSEGSRAVLDSGLRLALSAADAIADKLSRLPNDEFERLKTRAVRIEASRREVGLLDHLNRVDLAVFTADRDLPVTRRPPLIGSWKNDLDRFRKSAEVEARIVAVEDALEPLLDDSTRPGTRLGLLALVAVQPAGDIEMIDRLFTLGEQVVAQALDLVSDLVREGRSDSLGIEDIKRRGRDLGVAANAAIEIWTHDD